MEHLDLNTIQAYIEKQNTPLTPSPLERGAGVCKRDAGGFDVEAHLAVCDRCYGVYMGLLTAGTNLAQSFGKGINTPLTPLDRGEQTPPASCPVDWDIAAFIKDETPVEISKKISAHLRSCEYCLERTAGYYKALNMEPSPVETPVLWKQKAAEKLTDAKTLKVKEPSLLRRISAFLPDFGFPGPAFAGLAAALLAIAVVIWLIIPGRTMHVTASNEKIVIRDSEVPSSFGFTGTGETREVKNMEIAGEGGNIIFKWKPVEGAEAYEFSLRDEGRTIFSKSLNETTRASLLKQLIEEGKRYNWIIIGRTSDNKYFEYTGDFIVELKMVF